MGAIFMELLQESLAKGTEISVITKEGGASYKNRGTVRKISEDGEILLETVFNKRLAIKIETIIKVED